jgi:hypothetical protein
MRGNLADIRWKDHKKFVRKGISFRPEYAEMIDRISAERKITQREVLEEGLKNTFGEPEK